ncbi:hypothetical protein PCH70_21860 [Pseudomonas cichorii JBC1]|nr:hypothetical protein PCH70_21860 [Pseudomonas cichorii JBC1]
MSGLFLPAYSGAVGPEDRRNWRPCRALLLALSLGGGT